MAYLRAPCRRRRARAVQIVHRSRRGSRTIEHVGSAHDDLELKALKAAARQRLAGRQAELDLGLGASIGTGGAGGVVSEPIQAHLTVVFAALPVVRLVEDRTGWSIRRFVRTARRYRTVQIRAGLQILTAQDPLRPSSARRSR